MKYTIEGFDQAEAVSLGLDMVDIALLRWLVDFYNTGKMKFIETDGQRYFWVHYQTILENLPIIRITTRNALALRLKRLCSYGVLSFYLCPISHITYYNFVGDVLASLLEGGLSPKAERVSLQKQRGSLSKSRDQYNSSIINSSINDNKKHPSKTTKEEEEKKWLKEKKEKEEESLNQEITTFWKFFLLKTKKEYKLTPDRRRLIGDRLIAYELKELKFAVENFVKDDWPGRSDHLDLIYCIGKQKGKPDNLEKWLNKAPKKKEVRFE